MKVMPKKPTLLDVAQLAGTTKGTASRALNGRHWVAEPTRLAVLKAARELGFQADVTAQRLATGRSESLVGLFAPSLDLGVVTRKLQLMQMALAERGFDASIHACSSDRQAKTLLSLCRQKPAAIACYTLSMSDAALRVLQHFSDEGGAVVCFDTPFELKGERGDYVVFDRADNTFQAAKHLVELGHRRIGFFSSSGGHDPNRLRGFKRALRAGGISWSEAMSFFGAQFQQPGEMPFGEQIGQRMAAHFCSLKKNARPTAMCITDDNVCAAFVAQIVRAGLRVPQDVSVVGHDDLPVAAFTSAVPLTTVSQPVEKIAHETVNLLTSRLSREYSGGARRVVLQGELIVRESTARKE
jgi:LacI family transcriptional regulator